LLIKIEHPKLSRIVDQLYRPTAKYGSGSTADAVRHKLQTGQLLSKTGHIQKAVESRNALSDLINSGRLNVEDTRIASSIRMDLQNALTEKPWDKVYIGRQKL
jgi:filamentous hemagglutinin